MEVPARADWGWEHHSRCVDSLPYANYITSSGDFSNEDRGQAFRAQLFVDAKEVDL